MRVYISVCHSGTRQTSFNKKCFRYLPFLKHDVKFVCFYLGRKDRIGLQYLPDSIKTLLKTEKDLKKTLSTMNTNATKNAEVANEATPLVI